MPLSNIINYFEVAYKKYKSTYKSCSYDSKNNHFVVEEEDLCYDFDEIKKTKWNYLKSCDSLSFFNDKNRISFHEFKNSSYDRSKNNFLDKISGSIKIFNDILAKGKIVQQETNLFFILVVPMDKPRDRATAAMIKRSSNSQFSISSGKSSKLLSNAKVAYPLFNISLFFTTSAKFKDSLSL